MGADPAQAGTAAQLSWFVEEDRWHELTAVACDLDRLAHLPLWTPAGANPQPIPGRREVRRILGQAERRGISAAEIHAYAAELGDPHDPHVRRRAAYHLVRGEEPPLE